MTRKIVRLAPEHWEALAALPVACASCLFWEQDPVRRSRNGDAPHAKREWVEQVRADWGTCGQVVLVDDRPVGYLVYAPEAFVPGAAAFPTAPVSPDAVLLTTAYVDPAYAGGGLGRMLVQRMARDLVKRDVRAVEAFAAAEGAAEPTPCRLPVGFLDAVGFTTQRAHGTTPRMRMELRNAVTWKTPVEAALERLVGAVRPEPKATRGTLLTVPGRAGGGRGWVPRGRAQA